jgi:hypothetical protein
VARHQPHFGLLPRVFRQQQLLYKIRQLSRELEWCSGKQRQLRVPNFTLSPNRSRVMALHRATAPNTSCRSSSSNIQPQPPFDHLPIESSQRRACLTALQWHQSQPPHTRCLFLLSHYAVAAPLQAGPGESGMWASRRRNCNVFAVLAPGPLVNLA